jgi:diguanylate cyclase
MTESPKPEQTPTHSESLSEVEALRAENALLKEQLEAKDKQLEIQNERIKYLEEQAFIDPLTGTYNRRAFEPELEKALKFIRGEIQEHREGGAETLTKISLILLDLDYFKHVNDTFGHPIGDDVLRKVSVLLMSLVRETDMVARYGGEEFMILLQNADHSFAEKKAEEFRAGIEHITFATQPDLKITASFGVVSSESSTDSAVLKRVVDETLYKAKNNGRNRVAVYKSNAE